MTEITRLVFYVGEDSVFFKELEVCFKKNKIPVASKSFKYSAGNLISNAINTDVKIIYVDFSQEVPLSSEVLDEVRSIKNLNQFRGILFVALLGSEEDRELHKYLFSLGFQLCFIKGNEIETLYRDSFYISYREEVSFPQYARAKKMNHDLMIGISSTITSIENESFLIETDIESEGAMLSLKLPLFPYLKNEQFKLKTIYHSNCRFPMLYSYQLEFPFVSPWDVETEQNIHPSTVETWVDSHADEMSLKKFRFKIVSRQAELLAPLIEFQNKSSILIDFVDSIVVDFSSKLRLLEYQIIIIDLEHSEMSEEVIGALKSVVSAINLFEGHMPAIVICNTVETSNTLQELLNYKMVVASVNKLTFELAQGFIESFINKKHDESLHDKSYFFHLDDLRRVINVLVPIKVTSLTEHEVCFTSSIHFPMYSVLHFDLPFEFYATIVPLKKQLYAGEGIIHYAALIHGLGEDQLMDMRRFINQIIHEPIKSLSFEDIQAIRKKLEGHAEEESEKLIKVVAENNEVEVEDSKVEDMLISKSVLRTKL